VLFFYLELPTEMRKFLILLPILLVISCSRPSVYIPESYRVKKKTEDASKDGVDMEASIITSGEENEQSYIVKASYAQAWSAALKSVEYLRWPIAFVDEHDGVIRLKEAYVYRSGGTLNRMYNYPSQAEINASNVNDWLEKVTRVRPVSSTTAFTQENLKIQLEKISDDETKVDIDYSVRPYAMDGKIGYEALSGGYIESIIIERMNENLSGKPVAMN